MRQPNDVRVKELTELLPNQALSSGIPSDVLGSYTGNAVDDERPVQDADDL